MQSTWTQKGIPLPWWRKKKCWYFCQYLAVPASLDSVSFREVSSTWSSGKVSELHGATRAGAYVVICGYVVPHVQRETWRERHQPDSGKRLQSNPAVFHISHPQRSSLTNKQAWKYPESYIWTVNPSLRCSWMPKVAILKYTKCMKNPKLKMIELLWK